MLAIGLLVEMLSSAMLLSAAGCGILVLVGRRTGWGIDQSTGVQKLHRAPVPRTGGFALYAALWIAVVLYALKGVQARGLCLLLLSVTPAFVAGALEDMTQRSGIFVRLAATASSTLLGMTFFGVVLSRLNIPVLDWTLRTFYPVAVALTLFAGCGLPHAVNISDGTNGLAALLLITALAVLGVNGTLVGDALVQAGATLMIGALLGFLLWNFPFGRVFLGDGGAYLGGALVASLAILLVVRHPRLSSWSALLPMLYPVWETLFSVGRRLHSGRSPLQPDNRHLHRLLYSFYISTARGQVRHGHVRTFLTFLAVNLVCDVASVVWRENTAALMGVAAALICIYVVVYRLLLKWAPLTVIFDGSKSYEPNASVQSHTFDFGDGSQPLTQSQPSATHTCTVPVRYVPSLAVSDAPGNTARAEATVSVAPVGGGGDNSPSALLGLLGLGSVARRRAEARGDRRRPPAVH